MAIVDQLGATGFQETPSRRRYERSRGWVTIRSWEGPPSELNSFANYVVGLDPLDINTNGGVPSRVEASFADDDDDDDPVQQAEDTAIWELIPTEMDKPLGTHPAFSTTGACIDIIEQIEAAIKKGNATDTDWDQAEAEFMNDYMNFRIKGVQSFRCWSYIIRKTISVGNEVELRAEEINTQKIIPYSEIGIPTDVKWAQPTLRWWNGRAAEVKSLPIEYWLAAPPTIKYSRKKYDVVKYWTGAVKWYATLYEGGTALSTADGL